MNETTNMKSTGTELDVYREKSKAIVHLGEPLTRLCLEIVPVLSASFRNSVKPQISSLQYTHEGSRWGNYFKDNHLTLVKAPYYTYYSGVSLPSKDVSPHPLLAKTIELVKQARGIDFRRSNASMYGEFVNLHADAMKRMDLKTMNGIMYDNFTTIGYMIASVTYQVKNPREG